MVKRFSQKKLKCTSLRWIFFFLTCILLQSNIKQAIVSQQQQQQAASQQIMKDSSGKTFISPILDHSGTRKRQDPESGDFVPE